MTDVPQRLSAALADRYRFDRELGQGGDPDVEVGSGLWSRDGRWLVVTTVGGDIYVYRPDTDGVLMPLLTEGFNESAPALSPNGRWLAYVSDESGRPEVSVRSFPGVSDTKQQVSTAGGVEPRWAHSGREFFYKSSARAFVGVRVRAEEDFAVVDRRLLFTPAWRSSWKISSPS